jgi:hypothetical protein
VVTPSDVSAVIVTRGDVDITTILNSLPFDDVIVWNNGEREDLSCYGRFAGIQKAKNDLIYVQDDDILVPIPALLKAFDPATDAVFANKPPLEEWRFLGIGALFHRSLADCFTEYTDLYGADPDFNRVADVVFAYQHPYRSEWFGYCEFEWSRADNRMYKQGDHYLVRERARDRTLALPGRQA